MGMPVNTLGIWAGNSMVPVCGKGDRNGLWAVGKCEYLLPETPCLVRKGEDGGGQECPVKLGMQRDELK